MRITRSMCEKEIASFKDLCKSMGVKFLLDRRIDELVYFDYGIYLCDNIMWTSRTVKEFTNHRDAYHYIQGMKDLLKGIESQ